MKKYFNFKKNIEVIFLSDSKPSPTNFIYRIANFLQENSINYKVKFVSLSFLNLFKLYLKVFKTIFDKNCLIIQSHHTKSLLININIKLISKIFFYKNIYSFHTLHYELGRFNGIKLFIFKLSNNFIDQFSCVSESLAVQWNELFHKKIDIIYGGISNDEKKQIKEKSISYKSKIEKNEFYTISWVGRLELVKRPEYIFKVVQKLIFNEHQKIRIYIAGDGSLRKNILKNLNHLRKTHVFGSRIEVIYLGLLNRNKLFELIAKTDLYINTSNSESLCLTVIEFLSNPYCDLILPDIDVFKNYYECKRVYFFNKYSVDSLGELVEKNIAINKKYSQSNVEKDYPRIYEKLKLENTKKYYIDLFDYYIKK